MLLVALGLQTHTHPGRGCLCCANVRDRTTRGAAVRGFCIVLSGELVIEYKFCKEGNEVSVCTAAFEGCL